MRHRRGFFGAHYNFFFFANLHFVKIDIFQCVDRGRRKGGGGGGTGLWLLIFFPWHGTESGGRVDFFPSKKALPLIFFYVWSTSVGR